MSGCLDDAGPGRSGFGGCCWCAGWCAGCCGCVESAQRRELTVPALAVEGGEGTRGGEEEKLAALKVCAADFPGQFISFPDDADQWNPTWPTRLTVYAPIVE